VKWIDADEAAYWLRASVENVRVVAHRERWRRVRLGRRVWYSLADVTATRERRVLRM